MLRESARNFAARELSPSRLRSLRAQEPYFSRDAWSAMAGLGWAGLLVSEEHGGSGLGMAEACAVLEELGMALLPEPLVPCAVLAATALRHGDNPALQHRLLSALAAGQLMPALAWQEGPQFTTAASGMRTCAQSQGADWLLQGEKRFIRPGAAADGYLVAANCEGGLGLFWVPAGSPGLRLEQERLTDGGASGRARFDAVVVSDAQRLASPAVGQRALDAAIDAALLATGAELLGLMRGAMASSLDYLRTRQQFGKFIGSFQSLQHRAVDMYLQQELSAALVVEAGQRFDALGAGAAQSRLASRVKARTSEAALLIAKEAVHFHGAMGYTDECDIGLYLKRALSLAGWLGTATEHRSRYAALQGTAVVDQGAGA
jgi:alkylation response protein AidB-like acyl-CoA dehydrogenase